MEWPAKAEGETGESYARQIVDAEHWDLRNVIAVVEIGPKAVPSIEGHRRATTSPYYTKRQELLPGRFDKVRRAILDRDLATLGPVLEEEAIDLHLIAMSSHPPIFYWSPGTLAVLRAVRELRQEGLAAWATMDAGANVHVICDADSEDDVAERLEDPPRRRLRDPRRHRPRPGRGGGAPVLGWAATLTARLTHREASRGTGGGSRPQAGEQRPPQMIVQ